MRLLSLLGVLLLTLAMLAMHTAVAVSLSLSMVSLDWQLRAELMQLGEVIQRHMDEVVEQRASELRSTSGQAEPEHANSTHDVPAKDPSEPERYGLALEDEARLRELRKRGVQIEQFLEFSRQGRDEDTEDGAPRPGRLFTVDEAGQLQPLDPEDLGGRDLERVLVERRVTTLPDDSVGLELPGERVPFTHTASVPLGTYHAPGWVAVYWFVGSGLILAGGLCLAIALWVWMGRSTRDAQR